MEKSSVGFVGLVSIVAALGGLLFVDDTAVISGAIGFLQQRFALDNFMMGWAVSCLTFGATIGTGFAGKISDRLGHESNASALPNTVFVIARMIGGFGIGISSVQSSLYIAEIAPARLRGVFA